MCVIIIKDSSSMIDKKILQSSSRINPDGLGVVWLDDYSVEYFKSYQYKVLQTERPFIAHFRYATVGKVNKENTHPFVCGNNPDELLMMNGTIKELGDKDTCDSKVLANILGDTPRHTWKSQLEKYNCRFVTINTKRRTYQIYNKDMWTKHNGILYSKNNVLEYNYIAVYGTLKYGYSNYHRYLGDSTYIGSGTTKNKYPLIIKGLPYLINKKGVGHNVIVDVFRINDDTLARLDKLEGHPNWYERKQVQINVEKEEVKCWVYFNNREKDEDNIYHKIYRQDTSNFFAPLHPMSLPKIVSASNDVLVTKECDSCLEWYETEDEAQVMCDQCSKWLAEFYKTI